MFVTYGAIYHTLSDGNYEYALHIKAFELPRTQAYACWDCIEMRFERVNCVQPNAFLAQCLDAAIARLRSVTDYVERRG